MKKFVFGIIFGAALTGMFMNSINIDLQRELDAAQVEMNRLGNEAGQLRLAINDLKIENAQLYESIKWTSLGEFKVTFYWPGEDEYGSLTSTGVTAREGRTIAVDPTVIPYGTEVMIDGHLYIAEDCGSAVKGKVIDIFVEEPYQKMYHAEVFIKGEISQWNYVIY